MNSYIVIFDRAVHDYDSAVAELSAKNITISKDHNMKLMFRVEANDDAMSSLSGIKTFSLASQRINQNLESLNDYRDFIADPELQLNYDPVHSGQDVTVYMVDTGIDVGHNEFVDAYLDSRINMLYTNFSDYADNSGHGTAMSSLIIGKTRGCAPNCNLQVVKLFDQVSGDITVEEIVNAMDAIYTHHMNNDPQKVKVVCLPWTTDQNDLVDLSIIELNDNNMVVVCAAGNDSVNISTKSPAGINHIITVGSHNRNFEVSSFVNTPYYTEEKFVNYGSQLDIFAIGDSVSAASAGTQNDFLNVSGTSVSTAIVAGITTHYIEHDLSKKSTEIKESIISEGSYWGHAYLLFDESDANVDYSQVNKSMIKTYTNTYIELADKTSGRIADVKLGDTASVDIGLNPNSQNVKVIDFAPPPPWVSFDPSTGIFNIQTQDIDESLAPGIYLFAIKGEIYGEVKVEEYSVGLYNESQTELTEDTSSYYYDPELNEYDEVVSYQVATVKN